MVAVASVFFAKKAADTFPVAIARRLLCFLLAGIGWLLATPAMATEIALPAWRRWPEALTKESGADGRYLWQELRCGACHKVSEGWREHLELPAAPILAETTARVRAAYLERFLADPYTAHPGTVMPDVLHGFAADEKPRIVSALVHFLSAKGGSAREELPVAGSRGQGETLFHSIGCAACHGNQRPGMAGTPSAKPLSHVSAKYTLEGLTAFLRDPLAVRRAARMPDFRLDENEARAMAAFLLQLPEVSRVRYAYYEGRWNELPRLDELQPAAVGEADRIGVGVAKRKDFFALRFEGRLRVMQAGIYRFRLRSDDGARLELDGRVLIDNDGIHASQEKSTDVRLEAGIYPVRVDYFEHAGEEILVCEVEGPGMKRRPLDELFAGIVPDDAPQVLRRLGPTSVTADERLVEEGGRFFQTLRCAACHALSDSSPMPVLEGIPPADRLDPARGCLAPDPPRTAPRYRLSQEQRQALTQMVERLKRPPEVLPPRQQWQLTMATYSCFACHQRDGIGGVTPEFNAFFTTTTPEMGDEGRLPPPLDGVGGKLTEAWLQRILAEGANDRPYMVTRMPKFGLAAVGHLAALWSKADALQPLPPVQFPVPISEVKMAGWAMVGEGGFGCVKCHTFGRFPAQGIQSINLQLMHDRLRPEWFHRYMRNPAAFRPGTRMPSAWPMEGKSLLDYLGADCDLQIAAIWAYLEDGPRARIPAGLVTPPMELVPVDRAIVYRNFIAGAGARAIAVGFPEGVHMAFDAEQMRLALLWQGRFLDVTMHWTNRGAGFVPPAGDHVWSMVEGAPFAYLESLDQPWPTAPPRASGYQFLGYDTTIDGRPTFHYRFGDVVVDDRLDPAGAGRGQPVPRRLTLHSQSPKDGLYMRVAAGNIRQLDGQPIFHLDNQGYLRLEGAEPLLREVQGRTELLVPVRWQDGQATFVLLYSWE
ncbi:MAG: hypothetical protein KatS3mg110_3679 [Pirellulaceae bacterium]|nr:MAG: hypothetical protein KatS3mg110_3679 [Pirellulaceae bacterium]